MQIQPCAFEGGKDAGAPQLRLVQGLAMDRDQARRQVRAALQACLAPELEAAEDELHITNIRGRAPQVLLRGKPLAALHCSISHAPGLALLAWHGQRRVGVDIQAVETAAPRRELEETARLFLMPNIAQALMNLTSDALFFEAFASAWSQHEARLKCAGLGLVEWSGTLRARLTGMGSAPLPLMDGYAGAVAWWPATGAVA